MEVKRAAEGEKGFEKVFAFLRERLLAGSLKPGDRLISERERCAPSPCSASSRSATASALW
jgi:DNA-binding FadR family transcriptional regulator